MERVLPGRAVLASAPKAAFFARMGRSHGIFPKKRDIMTNIVHKMPHIVDKMPHIARKMANIVGKMTSTVGKMAHIVDKLANIVPFLAALPGRFTV